jgi:hypothetical protein
MALLTVEIPEKLLAKLKRTGRPAQEVIVEALEKVLNGKPAQEPEELSREEIVKRLLDSGFARNPDEYDSPEVQAWLALSEEERKRIVAETDALWFPDSAVSQAIIDQRR